MARTQAVVLAAERGRRAKHASVSVNYRKDHGTANLPAATRTDANDGDGGARQPDECVHVLDDDAEASENLRDRRVARRAGRLAALDGASRACARGLAAGHGGGGGKDGER